MCLSTIFSEWRSRVSFLWPAYAFSFNSTFFFRQYLLTDHFLTSRKLLLVSFILSFYLKESKYLNIMFVKFRCELNTNNMKICEGRMKQLMRDMIFLPLYVNSGQRLFPAEGNSEKVTNLALSNLFIPGSFLNFCILNTCSA